MVLEAKGGSTFSDEEVVKIKLRARPLHLKAQRLRPDGRDWGKSEQ